MAKPKNAVLPPQGQRLFHLPHTGARSIISLLVCGAMLSGCGGEKLPETYSAGDESLPSLTALVTLDKTPQCAEETGEDTTSYCYTELDAPVQAVTDYRSALESDYDCVPLSADGERLIQDETLSDQGELTLARESEGGLFRLDLSWDETSCTVTPSFDAGGTLPEESSSMTMEEAVDYFRSLPPSALGLSGQSMSDYTIFCEDGLVLLDGAPCLCLNVYRDGSYQGSFLFSPNGKSIYQLDRSTGQSRPLTP